MWYYERSLQSMNWKVDRSELIPKEMRELGAGSLHSIRDSRNDLQKSQFAMQDWENILAQERKKEERNKATKRKNKKKAFEDPEENRWLELSDYSMALYKDQLIAMKKVYKTHVDLTRNVRIELKQIQEISHGNLNSFIGVVHDSPHIFILSDIAIRGSLKDILENDEIRLDKLFHSSIILDIVKGMTYLHKSAIGAHYRLKSSNCLVDARWVIQLSSFGLYEFRHGEAYNEEGPDPNYGLLWTAPEQLRTAVLDTSSINKEMLRKGDIYSFGIILHEIFGREGPFGGDKVLDPPDDIAGQTMCFVDIIRLVKFPKTDILYRPSMEVVKKAPPCVCATMEACWDEDPLVRPNIGGVRNALKPLEKGL